MWPLLKPYYVKLLEIAWNDGSDTVGEVVGAFDLENEYVQTVLQDLAKRVKGVEDTTREEIQNVIGQMGREGLSIDQVRARLQEMAEINSASRAEMIARTESAQAYSAGSMAYYKESGVVSGMEWLTTDPCPICAPLDGKIADLGKQFDGGFDHPPAHPNCRCAIAPVLKGGTPEAQPQQEPDIAPMTIPDNPAARRYGAGTGQYREFTDVGPIEGYQRLYREWAETLTDDERTALLYYQEGGYTPLNALLRGHGQPDNVELVQQRIAAIDTAMDRTRVPYNVVSHRALVFDDRMVPGATVDDMGFASTSLNRNVAELYASKLSQAPAIARIKVEQGMRGALVDSISDKDQAELLLPQGTQFRVVSVSETTTGRGQTVRVVDLEVVQDDGRKSRKGKKELPTPTDLPPDKFTWQPGDVTITPPEDA